jgi:dihydrodipicolinate synthase/N-acetylneuraminate lyase
MSPVTYAKEHLMSGLSELHGIIPPLVTPFDADENVDVVALRAEVRFHLDLGVTASV